VTGTERTLPARTFRGAKVRPIGPKPPLAVTLHPQVEHYSAIGYELAMANRHKNWAKRWLRAHRPGKFV
jgi:hypothetical protein